MDGWVDGWMDEWMDGWIVNRRMDTCTCRHNVEELIDWID